MSLSGNLISPPGIKILFDFSLPNVSAAPKLLVITVKSRLIKRAFETSRGVDPIEMKMVDKPGKSGFQTFKHCYDAGVNFKNTGDTLIIAPQFICEKKHIDEIIEKLRTGISNYSKS